MPEKSVLVGLVSPGSRVLVVNGIQAQAAAKIIVGDRYDVVTWIGDLFDTDWTPLAGHEALLWLEPGDMDPIAAILHTVQGQHVRFLDAGKYDASDALSDGWGWSQLAEFSKGRVQDWPPVPEAPAPVVEPVAAPEPAPVALAVVPEPEPEPVWIEPEPTQDDHGAPVGEEPPVSDAELLEPPSDADEAPSQSLQQRYEALSLACNGKGVAHVTTDNVARFLQNEKHVSSHLWYDEFHGKVFTDFDLDTFRTTKPRPWTDNDDLTLLVFFQRHLSMTKIRKDMISQGVLYYASQNVRNEPKDWMLGLKWDGTPRLGYFFHLGFGAVQSDYVAAVSRNFLVSIAARILRPGCKVDTMPIFKGEQGIFKSRALRALGDPWFGELSQEINSVEFLRAIQGKMLVEISELTAFQKSGSAAIKTVLSRQDDEYRNLYDKYTCSHPRTVVFAGSTNEQFFLADPTGARRFWPILCRKVDVDYIRDTREQLFAEAVAAVRTWEHTGRDEDGWWVVPKDEAGDHQEIYRDYDEWESTVQAWADENPQFVEVKVHEIATGALGVQIADLDPRKKRRITEILRLQGWTLESRSVPGKSPTKVWVRGS